MKLEHGTVSNEAAVQEAPLSRENVHTILEVLSPHSLFIKVHSHIGSSSAWFLVRD